MPEGRLKYIDKPAKTRDELIRQNDLPLHSKAANKSWYKQFDKTFRKKNHINLACCNCIDCRLRRLLEKKKKIYEFKEV